MRKILIPISLAIIFVSLLGIIWTRPLIPSSVSNSSSPLPASIISQVSTPTATPTVNPIMTEEVSDTKTRYTIYPLSLSFEIPASYEVNFNNYYFTAYEDTNPDSFTLSVGNTLPLYTDNPSITKSKITILNQKIDLTTLTEDVPSAMMEFQTHVIKTFSLDASHQGVPISFSYWMSECKRSQVLVANCASQRQKIDSQSNQKINDILKHIASFTPLSNAAKEGTMISVNSQAGQVSVDIKDTKGVITNYAVSSNTAFNLKTPFAGAEENLTPAEKLDYLIRFNRAHLRIVVSNNTITSITEL